MKFRTAAIAAGAILVTAVVVVSAFNFFRDGGILGDPTVDARLAPFVQSKPAYPVVFTSRSNASAFRPAAALGDYSAKGQGVNGTGQPQWQASEGRLRALTTHGTVRELTWNRPLPDGGTLIDAMSPTISSDGNTVYFAGRQASANGGRFRIYSVQIDGSNLQQLTGGPDDAGCVQVPPLRFAADGTRLSEEERKRIDFDDVDPFEIPGAGIGFASSRIPDTGGRDRRATQLWVKNSQGARPLTASRANDRWPFITNTRAIGFTLWSKQDEVVSADGLGLIRHDPPKAGLTAPSDRWLGASIAPTGESFSALVKLPEPVWRPRPLFNGNVVFLTPFPGGSPPFQGENEFPENGRLTVAQAKPGQISSAPSSLAAGSDFPEQAEARLIWAPSRFGDREYSLATPSPMPSESVVLSAATMNGAKPGDYGLFTLNQGGWGSDPKAPGEIVPLFDDPDLIDAEPVAAYPRSVPSGPLSTPRLSASRQYKTIRLVDGKDYSGAAGELHGQQLSSVDTGRFPSQQPTGGAGRIVPNYKYGQIEKIALFASHRDRFDDPEKTLIRGQLEKLLEIPTEKGDGVKSPIPVGSPTLLVGLDSEGKVASATGDPDAKGVRGKFFAFAGDHLSGTSVGGYHFCTGCHTGHTFNDPKIAERLK